MTVDKDLLYKEIKLKAVSAYKKYYRLLKTIETTKDSEIHNTLWDIRAVFELVQVEIKYVLDKPNKTEYWQHEFLKKNKKTKLRNKAIKRLKKHKTTIKKFETTLSTDLEEAYKYIWKVKETISMVMDAFPIPKYKVINGKLKREREDIFVL